VAGSVVSSTNITEILLKVALSTITLTLIETDIEAKLIPLAHIYYII
jgi:hypothetical protein